MLSFRAHQALVHLLVVVVVLGVAAAAGYAELSRAVHGQLDSALLSLAEIEVGMIGADPSTPARVHEAPPGPAPFSFIRLDRLVQITDLQGHVLARSSNLGQARLPTPPALIEKMQSGGPVFETRRDFGEEPVRVVSMPIGSGAQLRIVQVAGSLDDVDHVVESAGILFIAMGAALILALGTAGTLLNRRVFGAIDDVVRQARRIYPANLAERLKHPRTQDEIGRLVETLNEMLARIEHSFEAQRRFTSDASHELRSPLSRLRTELEVTLRRPRDGAEYVQALRSCLEEVERLTLLVDELLALARLDAGQERDAVQTVVLNDTVREVVDRLSPQAHSHGVELVVEPGPVIPARGGRASLELVISNLLDNALKFTRAGGRVDVQIGASGAEAYVRVADTGPGIAPGELVHLFDRFYRGSAARASEVPGTGLGLALSQAIMQSQGGRIEAANAAHGGAVFDLRVPLAESATT